MKRNVIKGIIAAISVIVVMLCVCIWLSNSVRQTASEVHYLAFASDRHHDEKAIKKAMSGMPSDVEYVAILGDITGSGGGKIPVYKSSSILDEINGIGFKKQFDDKSAVILCGNHDKGINDDANIGFGIGEEGSGLMHTGEDDAGNPLYYVYGIACKDMKDKGKAEIASKAFEEWIDTITDRSVPVIVCCHYPLHYAKKESKGALVWNLALNYAATGYETTEAGAEVSRNVIYFYAHNHTDEGEKGKYSGEFYIPCGSEMEIGPKKNVWSTIYYTYTTAGYLRMNKSATLVAIDPEKITLTKYKKSSVADDLYDTESRVSGDFASRFETLGTNTITRVKVK